MIEKVYVLACRENGEVFSSYMQEERANAALIAQEEQDKRDETFEPNFYKVEGIYKDDVRFADAVKFADK